METLAHVGETTLVLERPGILENALLLVAPRVGDRITLGTSVSRLGVLDDLAVLNIEATNFGESTGGRVVVGDKLGDNCEFLGGIDGVAGACAIEVLDTLTIRIEITAIGIADRAVAVSNGAVLAAGDTRGSARMGGIGSGNGVGLPDIHLIAASTPFASTSIGIIGGADPSFNVGLVNNLVKKDGTEMMKRINVQHR